MYIPHVENQSKGADLKKHATFKVQEHAYSMRPELKFKRRNTVSPLYFQICWKLSNGSVMRFSSLYMDTLRKKSNMTILLISTNRKEIFPNIQAIRMEY